jgi:hypothetical protein
MMNLKHQKRDTNVPVEGYESKVLILIAVKFLMGGFYYHVFKDQPENRLKHFH